MKTSCYVLFITWFTISLYSINTSQSTTDQIAFEIFITDPIVCNVIHETNYALLEYY